MSQLFASSIGVLASASVLPVNIQDFFPLDGLVESPFCPRDSQESSPTPQLKASILQCSAFFIVQISHPYMTTGNTIALMRRTFVGKVMSLLFKILSRLVITLLLRSKLQSPSAVILEPKKIKSATVSVFSPFAFEVMGLYAMIFIFLNVEF